MSSQDYKLVLMAQDPVFESNMHLLSNPNVWIADTGASLDSTQFSEGCVNVRPIADSVSITGHDGAHLAITAIVNILGVVYDLHG